MVRIFVTWDFVGFHHWPDAKGQREYLAHRHRHKFFCRAEMTVTHSDREVEFHDLLDFCKAVTDSAERVSQSCEQIALLIGQAMLRQYGQGRNITVEVSEDNECGAIWTNEK